MKTLRPLTIKAIALFVMTILLSITSNGWAKAVRVPVSNASSFQTVDFGKQWFDEDGIWHIRGATAIHPNITGDIEGFATVIFSANIDLTTGDGDLHGYAIWDATFDDLSGVFEGSFSGTFSGFVYEITTAYHGSGDFDGMKLFLTVTGAEPMEYQEGYILDPHGTIVDGD